MTTTTRPSRLHRSAQTGPADRLPPFVPGPPEARYEAPTANVDPDRSKSWVKRMHPIVWSHRWLVVTGIGGSLLTLLLQIAGPRILMDAIDKSLVARTHALTPYVVALAVLAVLRYAVGYVFRLNLQKTALAIEFDLRTIIYDHLTRLSFSYFDRMQTGQLISRANSDIRSVQMFLAFAPMVAVTILTFFVALAQMLVIHWKLALVAVVTMPFVYVAGVRMRKVMFPVSWIVQGRMADIATIVEENITGTRVVKSFAAEEHQIRLLAKAAEKLRWANNVMVDMRARYAPILQNLPRLGLAIVLLYGGKLVIDGEIKVGALVAFNAYVVMLQAPFMMLGFFMMLSQRAAASASRIFEILDEQPAVYDRPGAVDLLEPRGEVELRDVRFGYGDEGPDVLKGFSLKMSPGETVALVGRTGSGKSTVARLLPRFYDVRDGHVLVDGLDVRDLTVESLRSQIGLVLDEPFLFSESIRDNIAYGRPEASMDEVRAVAEAAGAAEFIDKLPDGYDTVVGERGYTLSGGQRQRIAIARTLLVNPRILILDDATSAIDVQVEHEIHSALRTLMEGRTTLVIAHRLSTIGLADRVVLLEDGRITAAGSHTELLTTVPAYAEVLARAEEEWQAAHAPPPEVDEADLPPRMRAMKRMAQGDGTRRDEARPPAFDTMGAR